MKTLDKVKTEVLTSAQQKEKVRLELLDKKVEIQKKRMEIKKERLNMDEIIVRRNTAIDEQKVLIDKISELRYVLSDYTIDGERTLLSSEPYLTTIISDERREVIIKKLMQLINKL
jgi:hypothetical protein